MLDGDIIDLDRTAMNLNQYMRDENGDVVMDDDGNPIENVYPPGQYVFKLSGTIAGESEQLDMQMSSRVDSVTMNSGGEVTLNLTGGERATLAQIKQILDA
jgi:flagellar basal-body rod modification protein FlgD